MLRPCPGRSVDWGSTGNVYSEGDNLDALKLLRETYAGRVKVIYIDPPYNTGHDFVYRDDFSRPASEYAAESRDFSEDGGRLVENLSSNGRFHSDWCSMIYPRLLLARDFLTEDGAIFISIDDNEATDLIKIMDEIFGLTNRIAIICHKSRASVSNDKVISSNHNFVLFYAKNASVVESQRRSIGVDPDLDKSNFPYKDSNGDYRLVPVDGPGNSEKGNPYYEFQGVAGYWRFSKAKMQQMYDDNLVVKKGSSLYQKYYLSQAEESRRTVTTWWDDAGLTSSATSSLNKLMGGYCFSNPKPVTLITRIMQMMTAMDEDALVMDFFSGSATTAEAVFETNRHYGGNRRFILVQLPETDGMTDDAKQQGFDTLCDVADERVRRAGRKVLEKCVSMRGMAWSRRMWVSACSAWIRRTCVTCGVPRARWTRRPCSGTWTR